MPTAAGRRGIALAFALAFTVGATIAATLEVLRDLQHTRAVRAQLAHLKTGV